MKKEKDITNKTFWGTLTAIKRVKSSSPIEYIFQCVCGKRKRINKYFVIRGHSKSCGCLKGQLANLTVKKNGSLKGKRLKVGVAAFNKLFGSYKRDAKRRGISFKLSKKQFKNLNQQCCVYCGAPPSSIKKEKKLNGVYQYNGIDRLDSSLGYTIENCVSCCGMCNYAKSDHSLEEFFLWIKRLKEFNSNIFSKFELKGDV